MTRHKAIEKKYQDPNSYIFILNHHIKKIRSLFSLCDYELIHQYKYDLYTLKELVKSSGKPELSFQNTLYAPTESDKLGGGMTNLTQTHKLVLDYVYDTHLEILYISLENKTQKREKFSVWASQHNYIALSYMSLNSKKVLLKGQHLPTIDITLNITPSKQISSPNSYPQKFSFNETVQVTNKIKETVGYQNRNNKLRLKCLAKSSGPTQSYFSCKQQSYCSITMKR